MSAQQRTLSDRKKQWRRDISELNDRAKQSAWNLIEHNPQPTDLQLIIEDIDDEAIAKQAATRVFRLNEPCVLCLKAICYAIPEMREEVYAYALNNPSTKILTMVTQYCEETKTLERIWDQLQHLGPSDAQLRVIAEWSVYLRDRAVALRKNSSQERRSANELEELDAEMFYRYFELL